MWRERTSVVILKHIFVCYGLKLVSHFVKYIKAKVDVLEHSQASYEFSELHLRSLWERNVLLTSFPPTQARMQNIKKNTCVTLKCDHGISYIRIRRIEARQIHPSRLANLNFHFKFPLQRPLGWIVWLSYQRCYVIHLINEAWVRMQRSAYWSRLLNYLHKI